MFVRTKTPRSWLSHLFSSQLSGVFILVLFSISAVAAQVKPKKAITDLGYTSPAPTASPSPTPELNPTPAMTYSDIARDKNSPINVAPFKVPEGKTDWKEFFRNVHGSYGLSFMGPRIAGSGNETYNIYIPDVAPVQLSHTWQLGVQVNPNVQLGFSVNSIQNIADGVTGKTGIVRGRTFETYDPEMYVNLPNLVQVPGWFVFTSAKMSFPLSDVSKRNGKITQVTLDQSWTYTRPNSDWSFGGSVQIQPIFFSDPMPSHLSFRKTLYTSIGHLVSYRISPILNVQSTSTLDFDYRSPAPKFTSNLDDTSRLALYLSPAISNSIFLSLGGYFQFLLWAPTMETSIIGMDFTISF